MKNARGRTPGAPLTQRQFDTLLLLADGETGSTIAAELGVRPDTVHVFTAQLKAKLGAKSTAHAVAIAYHTGLLAVARA